MYRSLSTVIAMLSSASLAYKLHDDNQILVGMLIAQTASESSADLTTFTEVEVSANSDTIEELEEDLT